MPKYAAIGSNAFSGQDFSDLLRDQPRAEAIGIGRSPEKPPLMLRYRDRGDGARFRFVQREAAPPDYRPVA